MTLSIFGSILIVLALTIIAMVICRYAKLPTILGYLIIGVIVGPHGIGWLSHLSPIKGIAEFGVVFLMFMVGLEFSLTRLNTLRHSVFVLGGLQVVISIIITTILGVIIGMPLTQSIIIGGIVAMSSTAIVIKQLNDQFELDQPYALNAVGILLFQDLAVIPFFIIIGSLTASQHLSTIYIILWALVKGIVTVGAMLALGRWVFRPIFHLIMNTRIRELFTLTALLVTLFCAWLTYKMGLSLALGAFIGGVLLSESKFRNLIQIEIRPFRDILMGIFFISIGLLLNLSTWGKTWMWILLLLIGILLGKAILIVLLNRIFGYDRKTSFRTAITLSQGGEFGFAILTLAMQYSLLPADYAQVILGALILSFALAPILIQYNDAIATFLLPKTKRAQKTTKLASEKFIGEHLSPVVLCGFGRVGQNLGRILKRENCNYIAIDEDSKIIHDTQLAGEPVIYGDATHPDLLSSLHLDKAKALVISFSDIAATKKILEQVRLANSNLPIIARCKDDSGYQALQKSGATHVVAEIYEESLSIAYHLLQELNISAYKVSHLMQQIRVKDYKFLREFFHGQVDDAAGDTEVEQLRPCLLPENAHAIGQKIKDIDLSAIGVTIIAVRRKDQAPQDPQPSLVLNAGDIIILFGKQSAIEAAELKLLKG